MQEKITLSPEDQTKFKRKNNSKFKIPYTYKTLKDNMDPVKVKSIMIIASLYYGKEKVLEILDITDPVYKKMNCKGIIPRSYGYILLEVLQQRMEKDGLIDEEGYLKRENCYIYDSKLVNYGFRGQKIRPDI